MIVSKLRPALTAVAAALVLSACVATVRGPAPGPVIRTAPPPPQAEVIGVAPAPGTVWIGGYWNWIGDRHVWVPGHWVAEQPGRRWIAPRWEAHGSGWRMHPGHWS